MPYAAPVACRELGCAEGALADGGGRCAKHRRTTSQRGYGTSHQRVREGLRSTLPGPCGYGCGVTLQPDGPWVAAHRVDGHPEYGYLASCLACNQQAKGGGHAGRGGRVADGFLADPSLTAATVTRVSRNDPEGL